VMDEVGADALRFSLINGTAPGADQRLGASRVEGSRNFANKLWNAARFVLGARPTGLAADAPLELPPAELLGPAEHWILARCAATIEQVDRAYDEFALAEATRLLYDAIWSDYCDWYLELAKVRLADAEPARAEATWRVLAWVLDRYLRLLHPVMPHITEAIWQRMPRQHAESALLITAGWPSAGETAALVDARQASGAEQLIALVHEIRTVRAEAGTDPAAWLSATLWLPDAAARSAYDELLAGIGRLARIRPALATSAEDLDQSAGGDTLSAMAGSLEARLARSGADLERDRVRLTRDLDQARALLEQTNARLADERFTSRAPAAVVDATRARADELRDQVHRLTARLNG
jgi:valyl-tRNA synthetase